jgi:hypothetical protein
VSEKSITQQQARPVRWQNEPSAPPNWLGPTLVIDFVVSMAGEAYDAHEQEVQIANPG